MLPALEAVKSPKTALSAFVNRPSKRTVREGHGRRAAVTQYDMTVVNTDPMPFIHPTHSGHSLFCWHIRCVTSVLCDEIQAIHFFLPTPAGVIAEKAFRLAGCTHARRKIFLLEPVCVCLCVFAWLVGGWWAVVCPVRCGSRLPSGSNGQWLCAFRVVSCRVMSFHSVSSGCLLGVVVAVFSACVCVCVWWKDPFRRKHVARHNHSMPNPKNTRGTGSTPTTKDDTRGTCAVCCLFFVLWTGSW